MKKISVLIVVLAAVLLAACGGGKSAETAQIPVAEPIVVEEQPVVAEEAPVEQPAEVEQPVEEQSSSGSNLVSYTSPEELFTIDVPGSWMFASDTQKIDNSTVETYTSPDGHAFVGVVVNESGIDVSAVEKGQITLDFMKRLYGSDLRVAKDVLLDDGREKLEWWSDFNGTSGTTYFDTKDNYLYLISLYYEDKYEDDYLPLLNDVADSFSQ